MTQVGGHLDSQELHVAGATVRHDNPFADLQVPVCDDMDFRIAEQWVIPIYFGLESERAEQFVQEHLKHLDATIIENLLSQFDWRCRIAAAYLIGLRGYTEFDDWMGKLLLRSDVCFAGKGYCLAFAIRPTSAGIAYLNRYLQYYLSRSDLFFDQGDAMAALIHIDKQNGTALHEAHMPAWDAFVKGKRNWELDRTVTLFDQKVARLRSLSDYNNWST